ncbi:NAD(P)-binding protein [Phialemonium atrogriseum]|uniref:NAD(P)-binding protein n=1 Tax=Phialemonium atrogriseum TaxID=1093897 RepID=A0AAJ0BQ59_9PEZI|nr:NAD(P)-binding protein [Phialemonium atrogriseum]KAK1762428.1 NAD(P)-binding protein [Phialemonium atrogriseum]
MGSLTDSKITIAVIGFGIIGPRHADAILQNDNLALVAIVDPIPQPAASKYSAAFYQSIDDLLASPHKPDAAIVCTPNHTHAAAAKELADAGVHMIIEKPFSTSAQSGRELAAHLEGARVRAGVRTLVGHHRRFNPYAVATAEAIGSGSLGRIVGVNGLWGVLKPMSYYDAEWRRTKAGGPVLINLVHDVDLLHSFLGPIVRVHAEKTPSRRGFESEEGAAIIFRFKTGAVGTFFLCDNVATPFGWEFGTGEDPRFPLSRQDCYRIFGTDATLSVPDMTRWSYDGCAVKSWEGEMTSQRLEVDAGVAFERQLAHFVGVIRDREEPRCTPEAGLAALIVCEAVKKSLETEAPVDIEPYSL